MQRILFSTVVLVAVCTSALLSQGKESTTRIERQHKASPYQEKQLGRTEEQLISVLQEGSAVEQAQVVQTIRDLEQMFPKYSFSKLLGPLEETLKDETADPIVRRLAALALDELHSDAGDAVIRDVAASSKDEGLQLLCEALLVRSDYR